MRAASKADISMWFTAGRTQRATHLIVVCDTFDHDDYPVYARGDDDALEKYDHYNGKNMQRVMEVYDVRLPKQPQMDERRAFHLPQRASK